MIAREPRSDDVNWRTGGGWRSIRSRGGSGVSRRGLGRRVWHFLDGRNRAQKSGVGLLQPGTLPGRRLEQEHDHAAGDAHRASQAAIARMRRTIGTYTNRFLSLGAKFSI